MKFTMTKPCDHCPFRTDREGFLRGGAAEDIINGMFLRDLTFTCHETTISSDDDDFNMVDGPNAQHCAGALILMEHQEAPNQMMRIAERLGLYDRAKLNMDQLIFDDPDIFIEHHREACGY